MREYALMYNNEEREYQIIVRKSDIWETIPDLPPLRDRDLAEQVLKGMSMDAIACNPTEDDAQCRCGCNGYDERCDIWIKAYNQGSEVPDTHTCCKVYPAKMLFPQQED